ncbi:MAG: WecB/TagA/CpsF family glycosyltransferase [Chloroflexota bacterium]|nr:WecB/TagA/CpsF family glycosyltransferase [Chloroflexota bacterium]
MRKQAVDSIALLSIRIDNVAYADAMARIKTFLREPGVHHIATVNPEFVVMAQTNAEFRGVLNATALNVPDGVGLMWAARRLKSPLRERVAGQELVDRIAALAAERGHSIFFLGAREGIAERAARKLKERFERLEIAGCYAGSPAREEEDEIVARVNAANAQILFVAYGPPKQELWIARNAARLNVAVAMGVGGTFDTLAGIVPRAPEWMRRAGFEWTYRLLREPRRIKRQLAIPYFMWLVVTSASNSPSTVSN